MGKYIKYTRTSVITTPVELEGILNKIVADGLDIISYDERILEKNENIERLVVTMLCGKVNEGTKELLNS